MSDYKSSSVDPDHLVTKIVRLKTEAAKARIALRKLCDRYGLDMEVLLGEACDSESELIAEMQALQEDAEDYAERVIGF